MNAAHPTARTAHSFVKFLADPFDMFASADSGVFPWGEGNLHLDVAWTLQVGDVFQAPGYTATITRIAWMSKTRAKSSPLPRIFFQML